MMHPANTPKEAPRLSVDMMALPALRSQSSAAAAAAGASETHEFTILPSNPPSTRARTRTRTHSTTTTTNSDAAAQPLPDPIDRTTTVAHTDRRFTLSPRPHFPASTAAPKVEALWSKPDSGILLSRSGRLCHEDVAKEGEASVADSMAAGSGSGSGSGMGAGMGMGGYAGVRMGMGGWCRDVVGREMMAAERCGQRRAGVQQGPPAGRGLRRGVGRVVRVVRA